MEFNPDFIVRMIPKVEWAALLEAADHVRTLLPTSPAQCTPWVAGGWFGERGGAGCGDSLNCSPLHQASGRASGKPR